MVQACIRVANRKFNLDLVRKAELLDKAIEISKDASEFLESRYPYFAGNMYLIFGRAIQYKADLIGSSEDKRKLLQNGLENATKALDFEQRMEPNKWWNLGAY